ncbi:MAG: hypothetical protein KAG64_09260 [Bacteroidales bacterium]|nr:hypothetical protein [Bacteroidales bacterium]
MAENKTEKTQGSNSVSQTTANTKGYKITIGIMAAIIAVLIWMLLFAKEQVKAVVFDRDNIEQERVQLDRELDSLMLEYEQVQDDYGTLTDSMTTKDSVIQANAKEIKRLLAKSHDYRKIKRQLRILRGIQQSYVDQLDSLYTVNHELQTKLEIANVSIQEEQSRSKTLSKEKEALSKKVEVGSVIKAYNVTGKGYHLKGKKLREVETHKARRTDRVKICFTLAENLVADPGEKTVYIRVARPDGVIIRKGDGDAYAFVANKTKLQFTMKKSIDYKNKAISMCVLWDKHGDNDAMKGTYNISVYMDHQKIGSSSFELE